MLILFSVGSFYPEITGGATHIEALLNYLKGKYDFRILCGCSNPALAGISKYNETTIYRIKGKVGSLFQKALSALRVCIGYFKFGYKCNILHAHGFTQMNVILVILAKLTGKKILFSVHTAGHDDPLSVATSRFGRFKKIFFKLPDKIISISPGLYKLCEDYGIEQGRLKLVLNGVDTARFKPVNEQEKLSLRNSLSLPPLNYKIIMFVGYMIKDKGLHLLLKAWSKIRNHFPTVKILAICPQKVNIFNAKYSEEIRNFIQKEGLSEDIIFRDKTLEIEKYLNASDLFVLPSYREGLPNILLEAMASGLACVVTRLPGSTDFLIKEGISAVSFEKGNSNSLADKLKIVLGNENLLKNLSIASRNEIVKDYNVIDASEKYSKVYESLFGIGLSA